MAAPSHPAPVQIVQLHLPLDDDPASSAAPTPVVTQRPPDHGPPLPNRFLPPEHVASGSQKGRAEFEARQLVALGRTSSLYHVHERAVAPWLDASRQQGSLAAKARLQEMRDEVDDLSLLFSAQASERAFQAAFAPLKAASREEEACAALEALQALLRVPPNLRQIEVDAWKPLRPANSPRSRHT